MDWGRRDVRICLKNEEHQHGRELLPRAPGPAPERVKGMVAGQMRHMVAVVMPMAMRRFLQRPALQVGMNDVVQMRFGGQVERNEIHPHKEVQSDQEMQPPTRRAGPATDPV
jgi:hypothetical protein